MKKGFGWSYNTSCDADRERQWPYRPVVTRNIKYGVILQYRNVCLPKSSLKHEIQSLHPSHCVRIII